MRILCTADWQLGKAFGRVGPAGDSFREQLFLTAKKIITTAAEEHGADIILILGDTFDRADADWALIERVAEVLRNSEKPIHIIPGNHDPWQPGGALESLSRELGDVDHVVFHAEQTAFHIEELGLTLYPGVLRQRFDMGDLTSWIPEREDSDGLRVGMFHGSIMSIAGEDARQRSIDPDVSESQDLDLTLMGDWHGGELLDQPDRRLWYAGAPEPQRIGHDWEGRVLLIDAELGRAPSVEPVMVGSLKFVDFVFEFDLDMDDPVQALGDALDGIEGAPELTYIRFSLTGEMLAGEIEGVMDRLEDFSGDWPFHSRRRRGLAVVQEDPAEADDERLHAVEAELHGMVLEDGVLARATVLLRRMYRRLGQ